MPPSKITMDLQYCSDTFSSVFAYLYSFQLPFWVSSILWQFLGVAAVWKAFFSFEVQKYFSSGSDEIFLLWEFSLVLCLLCWWFIHKNGSLINLEKIKKFNNYDIRTIRHAPLITKCWGKFWLLSFFIILLIARHGQF